VAAVGGQSCLPSSLATDHRLRTRALEGNESGIGDEDKVLSIHGGNFRIVALVARPYLTADCGPRTSFCIDSFPCNAGDR
jgi:hypothetical protein